MKKVSKKARIETINTAYWALQRAIDGAWVKTHGRMQGWFRDLVETCEQQERQHCKFIRHPRQTTLDTRTRYFVCKTLLADMKIKSAVEAVNIRADYVIAAAIRETVGASEIQRVLVESGVDMDVLLSTDYADHLA